MELFDDEDHIGFMVKDEAGGIPAKILELLGTPFLTTKANGTGLGLSICYDIARRHEAELKVETDHIGSTFIFSFYKHRIEACIQQETHSPIPSSKMDTPTPLLSLINDF